MEKFKGLNVPETVAKYTNKFSVMENSVFHCIGRKEQCFMRCNKCLYSEDNIEVFKEYLTKIKEGN
jgi:arginyl-tRNA--protein-N-Asp/Glu arginylyltransferase